MPLIDLLFSIISQLVGSVPSINLGFFYTLSIICLSSFSVLFILNSMKLILDIITFLQVGYDKYEKQIQNRLIGLVMWLLFFLVTQFILLIIVLG